MTFNIKEQIDWNPEVVGEVPKFNNVIVGGMGGSALPARASFYLDPTYHMWLHSDFGFPERNDGETLFIAMSYSGNTQETLSFTNKVLDKGEKLAIVTSGGKLLDIAKEKGLPYVQVPSGQQPRDSVIYMLKAMLALMGQHEALHHLENVSTDFEDIKLSEELANTIPLVYTSRENAVLGYIWKIVLNETAKTPAFCNYFPELTHNEMQGIAGSDAVKVLLLKDESDNDGVKKEMKIFEEVASQHGLKTVVCTLSGTKIEKLIWTLVSARKTAHEMAAAKGIEADAVPFIEDFKKEL